MTVILAGVIIQLVLLAFNMIFAHRSLRLVKRYREEGLIFYGRAEELLNECRRLDRSGKLRNFHGYIALSVWGVIAGAGQSKRPDPYLTNRN